MVALRPIDLLDALIGVMREDPCFEDRDLLLDCPGVNRLAVQVETNPIGDVVIRTQPDGTEPENPLTPLVEELAQHLYEAQKIINGMKYVAGDDIPSPGDVERMGLAEKYKN
jgi:hypothetical protein